MAGNLTAMIAAIFSGSTADPYFEYTTLLLPGNGTNGAQNNTFLDGSTNNFTITRNGNTTQGTFSPFSQTGWGNYFDGTGDYLTVPDNAAFAFGSGAVTIETWAYFNTTISSFVTLLAQSDNASAAGSSFIFVIDTAGKVNFEFYYGSSTLTLVDPDTVPINQWVHLAVARNASNTISLYVNGTRKATNASFSASVNDSSQTVSLGGRNSGIQPLNGYLSNSRIVKGTAVYDPTLTTLTVPTAPLTAISGTSLLTCQSNRFIDNSTNNFTITRNGDTRVVAFSPFNPTASWSAATYGGSGYFDGSGDYLTSPNNTAVDFGSGSFTVETWFYPAVNITDARSLFSKRANASVYAPFVVEFNASMAPIFYFSTTGSSWNQINSSVSCVVNAWNHVAITRNGSTFTIWINGVSGGTTTNASALMTNTDAVSIGAAAADGSRSINGYMSSVRMVKGTAVYTAAFTPPTAPLTAITNTSLLLNFTNAGIYDATSKNDLETVGNAQISTTQSKWGGSSIYLDGTSDYLSLPQSSLLAYGSGNFTVEFWLYRAGNVTGSDCGVIDQRDGGSGAYFMCGINTSQQFFVFLNSAYRIGPSASTVINQNTWYHIAYVRSSTTGTLYINGTSVGSWSDTLTYVTNKTLIGRHGGGGTDFNGYLDDIRITNGYARYTSNFTAPTAPFPEQ